MDAQQQEAEADGVAEPDHRLLVERGIDGAGGLGLGDEVGEAQVARRSSASRIRAAISGSRREATKASRSSALSEPRSSVTRWEPTVVRMSVTLPSNRCSLKSRSSSSSEWSSMAARSSSALPEKRP